MGRLSQHQGCRSSRTATKYRNTTTATRHPAGLDTVIACSATTMVGLREVRDKEAHSIGDLSADPSGTLKRA